MSTNPVSFRLPFESQMSKLPPEHQHIIRTIWNGITDLQGSIPLLKAQINSANTTANAAAKAGNTTTSSETVIINGSSIGFVNDETGETAYTSQQSDYGAFVLLGDASPIALTLNTAGTSPGIQLPWYCWVLNTGAGLVTITPASGTISYPNNPAAASMPLSQGQAAVIVFDGVNFTAEIICVPPQDTPAITHEWINSFNSVTGAFTQDQPDFSDLSGQIDTATQMPDSGVTAGTYAQATIAVDAEGLVTLASSAPTGFSGTIVTAQLTPTGAQGSMTFLDGRITAQTPAT